MPYVSFSLSLRLREPCRYHLAQWQTADYDICSMCLLPFHSPLSPPHTGNGSVSQFSHVQLFATPWTIARQASLSITNSRSPPKPMSIELVMPSNHLILCRPLLLPSIFPSIGVFSNESALGIRWPKYWSFSFNISPPNDTGNGWCDTNMTHFYVKRSYLPLWMQDLSDFLWELCLWIKCRLLFFSH